MRACSTVVTPTPRADEGRCMAAMEAIAVGIPVIAPDAGPFPYVVRHEDNGLLYATDSVASLQTALARLLGEPGLRARLRGGAQASSAALLARPLSFGDAVSRALGRVTAKAAEYPSPR